MGYVRERRDEVGLTQGEAAARASVSLATWRRIETSDAAGSFRSATLDAVEKTLRLPVGGLAALLDGQSVPVPGRRATSDDDWIDGLASYTGDPITPRQAFHLAMAVAGLEDVDWEDYVRGRQELDDLPMVSMLPDWVLFLVNNYWLRRFMQVFVELGNRLENGKDLRPENFAEEVALWLMIRAARESEEDVEVDQLGSDPELSRRLGRMSDDQEDWDRAAEDLLGDDLDVLLIWLPNFTRAIFGGVPALSQQLGVDLAARHPFRWWETYAAMEIS